MRPMTLQRRLLLLVLLLLLPVGAIDVYNAVILQRAEEAGARRDAVYLARQIDGEQERLIEGMRQVLVLASNTRTVREGDYPACAGMMATIKADYPAYVDLQVTDRAGVVRCATNDTVGIDIHDRIYWRAAIDTDRLTMGRYIFSRRDARHVLPLALSYRDTSGATAGAVVAVLDASWLKTYLDRNPLRSDATVIIADHDGFIVVREPDTPPLVGTKLPARFDDLIRAEAEGTVNLEDSTGTERVFGYMPPGSSLDLFVAVGLDDTVALAPAREAMERSFGLLGAVLALSLLAAWWGGRVSIQKPVATLVDTARRWQAGDRTARTGLQDGASEINTLGHAFDEMAASLQEQETARIQAVQALSESEARCRSIVETAVDAMVVIDERGTVQSFNPAAVRIFGYPADQVIDRNVSMLMPNPDHAAHDGYLRHYRSTGERKIIGIGREVEGQRLDGSTFPLELSIAEWRVGERRYFTGIMRDITLRKNAERELVQAKEIAEEANIAKSRFLASASHDLRQPLQSLFFFSSALNRHVETAEGRENLMHLERGLDAMKGLLDSLLDISRLDSGAVSPVLEDFPISVLLDHIAVAYAPVAESKGIGFMVVPTKAWVRSDRILLARIVRNLVENAVRYTERGRVLVDCLPRRDRLRIEVRDTGIGIPPEHIERIWDEFHQVSNPERDRTQGLGLGLTIVKRIIGILGHSVEVRSSLEEGSVFSIEVPLGEAEVIPDPAPAAAPPQSASANENGAARFAVLVDDDAIILLGLQTILKNFGYEVLVAASTEQAIRQLRELGSRPDIIVADYRLREGKVGTEAILQVRELFNSQVPGIILTGETGVECQQDAASHGLRIIHKPVTPRQLDAAIQNQMRMH
jgi:PAS domain S-box-containing protein